MKHERSSGIVGTESDKSHSKKWMNAIPLSKVPEILLAIMIFTQLIWSLVWPILFGEEFHIFRNPARDHFYTSFAVIFAILIIALRKQKINLNILLLICIIYMSNQYTASMVGGGLNFLVDVRSFLHPSLLIFLVLGSMFSYVYPLVVLNRTFLTLNVTIASLLVFLDLFQMDYYVRLIQYQPMITLNVFWLIFEITAIAFIIARNAILIKRPLNLPAENENRIVTNGPAVLWGVAIFFFLIALIFSFIVIPYGVNERWSEGVSNLNPLAVFFKVLFNGAIGSACLMYLMRLLKREGYINPVLSGVRKRLMVIGYIAVLLFSLLVLFSWAGIFGKLVN